MVEQEIHQTTRLGSGASLFIAQDYRDLSRTAANLVAETIAARPNAAITLPTGETPRGMYEALTEMIRQGDLNFGEVQFFCLDDYLGKGIEDQTSLTAWLDEVFLTPAGVHGPNIHLVPTLASNPAAAAEQYDKAITQAGGFELAVLGLGPNGHIGFNEPGSPIESRTRVVDLTEESRTQNAAYYESGQTIPDQAMTIGVGTLLESRRIVLIVSGASKAEVLRQSLEGPVTPEVPGSYLQTVGDRLTVIADAAAAAGLSQR
jgi:glucosamine-6-phosphate deaminase